MTDNIIIEVCDQNIGDELQRELASKGIHVNHLTPNQAVQFGMTFSTGKDSLEINPKELLQLFQVAPDAVEALFDTLERFRDRIKLFINGQPKVIPNQVLSTDTNQAPLKRKTFEDFVRGK